MYKTKARVYYDQFGGIAVVSCSDLVKKELDSSDIWSVFELKKEEKPKPFGLFEVELEAHIESCDCYELCSHKGYMVFDVIGVTDISEVIDQLIWPKSEVE